MNPADDVPNILRAAHDALTAQVGALQAQVEALQASATGLERLLDVARTAIEETVFLAEESEDVLALASVELGAGGRVIELDCAAHDRRVAAEALRSAADAAPAWVIGVNWLRQHAGRVEQEPR